MTCKPITTHGERLMIKFRENLFQETLDEFEDGVNTKENLERFLAEVYDFGDFFEDIAEIKAGVKAETLKQCCKWLIAETRIDERIADDMKQALLSAKCTDLKGAKGYPAATAFLVPSFSDLPTKS